jgi:Fe-Mn family superoxide dismutase
MLQLPELPYSYDALEPYVDTETMKIHHTRHHQTYINNFNALLEKYPELKEKNIVELLENLDQLSQEIQNTVRNNGGGHYNHSLFWKMMTPNASLIPSGMLLDAINQSFESFDSFKEQFNRAALTVFGSGWTWLAIDAEHNLKIMTTPQQDPVILHGYQPILGLDVWEHAYYLKYQNKRPDYVAAWWNVVNWNFAEKLYVTAMSDEKITP